MLLRALSDALSAPELCERYQGDEVFAQLTRVHVQCSGTEVSSLIIFDVLYPSRTKE